MTTRSRFHRRGVAAAFFALVVATALLLPAVIYAQAPAPAPVGDPTGAVTGTAKDVPVKDAANPTLPEVMDTVGHNKVAINFVWTLITGSS
jgi:Amt family ammonium transporter